MLEIVRVDDTNEKNVVVIRYQFRVTSTKGQSTFPKGEIRASRHGVVLAGPFFPMNPAAARLVQAALERAWLQADYMAWAYERTGRDLVLTEAQINQARARLRRQADTQKATRQLDSGLPSSEQK
jgi:hypothetical protein